MTTSKPRVFIASSVESLDVANAVNVNLDHQAEVTVWKNGFSLSHNTIDSLVKMAESVDFAVFIFTPDDVGDIRNQDKPVVRDNVVFELGLFTGTLGKERCFIVKPRDVDLHLPTDLLGLTPADYDGERSDADLEAAVNCPCTLIKKEVAKLGLVSQDREIQKSPRRKTRCNYTLGDIEHKFLITVLESESPDGVYASYAFRELQSVGQGMVSLAASKLQRMGYLDRHISADGFHECYAYSITADGIDYLLENEELVRKANMDTTSEPILDNSGEDIPF